jgi:hypothetical protein
MKGAEKWRSCHFSALRCAFAKLMQFSQAALPGGRKGMGIMKRRDLETRYKENVRKQQKILEDYAAHEIEWADDLLLWYRVKKRDMPDDEYRAAAFFKNREYLMKPGSLTLLYSMYKRVCKELRPLETKENGFDRLCYRFRVYAATLEKGGFNGGTDRG